MKAYRECVEMRTALAEEFRELKPLFAALGDENRQQPCWRARRSACGWDS